VHMEEDAGKLIHKEGYSLVDFNRAGIPLLEIVSEPHMNSPSEAHEYLANLKSILEYLDVSDCDMEKGSLRCDANISVRVRGEAKLGTKTELKNMNSFKAVKDALAFEAKRQMELLDAGGKVIQQTLLWDEAGSKTVSMRTKEEAQDYRYFPEPDLTDFLIDGKLVEGVRKELPELPQQKKARFVKDYGLSEYDAKILVTSKRDADFAEACMMQYQGTDKKSVANWLIGPLASMAGASNISISQLQIPGGAEELIKLINLERAGKVSNLVAKSVLSESIASNKPSSKIIEEKNLFQVSDEQTLEKTVNEVILENPKVVADFKSGKGNSLMFLVGQAMKKSQGKANPKVVQEILKRRLEHA
jgi:aspartyl-tRNA(Asn)/glutamyl-tRNA(Gln) amidotransferase subunit B